MKRLSIGLRLTLWYLAIFTVAQVVFASGMWLSLRHHLYAIVDDNLRDEVADLGSMLEAQKPDATLAKLREEVTESYADARSGEYLELYDNAGNLIFQSAALQEHSVAWGAPPAADSSSFRNQKLGRQRLRFMTCWLAIRERHFLVHFGLSLRQVNDTLEAFRSYLWIVAPLALLLAAAGGYWLSRRALAPVDQLARTARNISGASLSTRLEKLNTGDELQRLSDTLNRMLDRIETAFRRVTEFTADASHELRTPVALIRTEAELALRRSRNAEEYRAALEHILAEAERTTHLLEQLLALARADSGATSLEFHPIDLRDVLQQAADAWSSVIRARGMEFEVEGTTEGVMVQGDQAALRRVLDILLDNALKYCPAPGHIRLSLTTKDARAAITVQDTGVGIAPEEQTRIFERFYRVDKARSRTLGGAGLGLSIARWIVEQHEGEIRVSSEVGRGAAFAMILPLRRIEVGPSTPPETKVAAPVSEG